MNETCNNSPLISPMSGEPGPSCPISYPRIGGPTPLEQWILNKESYGGDPLARPKCKPGIKCTAFGIGQLTEYWRNRIGNMLSIDPNTTDFDQQLQLMRTYIDIKYGSTQMAINWWQSHGWY